MFPILFTSILVFKPTIKPIPIVPISSILRILVAEGNSLEGRVDLSISKKSWKILSTQLN